MHNAMKATLAACLTALAACTTPPPTQPVNTPAATAPAIAAVVPEDQLMTGSRIPQRKSTDRMLKTVGAQDARDAMDSALQPLNSNP
ncbi:hypothetical protein AB2N08_00415 [Massilia aurea]|uniref:hypothetical protein n=1 Tax=Massilia aurea TaxID=373040 RepID=UPI0034632340